MALTQPGETVNGQLLDKPALLAMLTDVIDEVLIESILIACGKAQQQPFSLFVQLALSELTKTRNTVKLSIGMANTPSTFDVNKEVWNKVSQFVGSEGAGNKNEEKFCVLKRFNLLEMASVMVSR